MLFDRSIQKATSLLFSHQQKEGTWWYTLEANETIGAGFIQLMHFWGEVDSGIQEGLIRRMLSEQRPDGSWAIFYEGPGDLSTTIECYFALRLAGRNPSEEPLQKAREFILQQGGLAAARVFTHIHLALFGLVPWSTTPSMPIWFILLPHWFPASLYDFSSWARASIVPLLIVRTIKPIRHLSFTLDELYQGTGGPRKTLPNFFIYFDWILKVAEKFPWHPGEKIALVRAEKWIREHIDRTEDIYPAMAYAILALKAMGYSNADPTIQKAFKGLKSFQQHFSLPLEGGGLGRGWMENLGEAQLRPHPPSNSLPSREGELIHQQCCISPLWDTPWAALALLESGTDPADPRLLQAARYMISKEIKDFKGDWKFKNPKGPAGGWSFEFQNDYFPDVDDAIEAIHFLKRVGLPEEEKKGAIARGLAWILSMQSKNGGWAAFDKNNLSQWVNRIPFSDHGACLDPPTPDITGRMIELLSLCGYDREHPVMIKALSFLEKTQGSNGSWRGRWGVSYIYGTWCVLQGLATIPGTDPSRGALAADWLKSIQNKDGGWGESCLSDRENRYVPLGTSIPSQTAWAVMGLVAAGKKDSPSAKQGIEWLVNHQQEDGGWEERHFTGTGFPGHFYIRYHGYRYYFPLLALGRFKKA